MNPFERLGLKPRLVLDREELNRAFREAGKTAHPDAGGSEDGFADLQQALNQLLSPSGRLAAWLAVRGLEVEPRGAVDPALMDLFGRVGEASQRAEHLIRSRQTARSVLTKALLEDEAHQCREQVEQTIDAVEQDLNASCAAFESLEGPQAPPTESAMELLRKLRFLEKWQASLRALYGQLL